MGRAGFFIFIFFWVCGCAVRLLSCSDSGGGARGSEGAAVVRCRGLADGRAEVGADHVEVEVAVVVAGDGGEGRSLSATLVGRGHEGGRAVAMRAEKNAPPVDAAIADTSVCCRTSFRHC